MTLLKALDWSAAGILCVIAFGIALAFLGLLARLAWECLVWGWSFAA